MTLKEQLAAKKAELKGLEAKINEGDDEAIKSGTALVTEIDGLEEKIKNADAALGKIKSIGTHEEPIDDPADTPARSLGENFVKHMTKPVKGTHFNISVPAFNAKANTDVQKIPTTIADFLTTLDRNVVTAARSDINIRNLFGSETITGNALEYLVEGAIEGDFANVAEGGKKPQVHFADPVKKVVSLNKVAAFIKESDEYIRDAKFLESAINGRLLYYLDLKEQNELVAALKGTSGIQTGTADLKTATSIADAIRLAKKKVKKLSGFPADTIVINPDLNYILDIGKDANGQYYGGGYFGNTGAQPVWGLNVVENDEVEGFIVGAFKTCGSVVTNGEGQSVEATNSNEDDFTNNLMTVRAEERMSLAVRRPAGFYMATQTA